MTRNRNLYDIAKFYKDKNQSIHVKLSSGVWLNGRVTFLESDRIILDEEKFGEMLILFDRIKDDGIEPREERR